MLWSVMYFQTLCKPECLFWLKGFIKRRNIVRVQVVTYKNNLIGVWIHVVKKPFDTFSPVHPGSLLFRLCVSPACKWLCE